MSDGLSSPWLTATGVSKRFGGVLALRDGTLDLRPGEVHGLVGANGAGKSTFIRVLAGLVAPDGGSIVVDGTGLDKVTPDKAKALRFSFIHQELSLVGHMNAVENALLGVEKPKRLGFVSWGAAEKQVAAALRRLDADVRLDEPVANLSVADQWLIVIARALLTEARLIAMDEPTASLSAQESERLYAIIRGLARDGITILYVSHKLDEITSLCDRVTAFRNGATVATVGRDRLSRRDLVTLIVGHEVAGTPTREEPRRADAEPVLRAQDLRREPAVRGASMAVRAGEIVGLAGLVGAGRSELARLIVGADARDAGEVYVDGRRVDVRSPHEAMRYGLAYVPEERRSQGLLLTKSVDFNITLASLQRLRRFRGLPLISAERSRAVSRELVERLSVRTPSLATPVGLLSGGNQQKVLVARYVAARARVLILDEPTRGVDVGAREEMYDLIAELARDGIGVVFISSDLEELVGHCDRILVMSQGEIVADVDGSTSKEELTELSYVVPKREPVEA